MPATSEARTPRVSPSDGRVAGMVLTGGSSRRMGRDKARLVVGGIGLAAHVAAVLEEACVPVVEVGPSVTGLAATEEEPPGAGPLAAVAAGWALLGRLGAERPTVVAACDLPLLRPDVVRALARWPGSASVVPVVAGRPQPLCARWSVAALDDAARRLATTRSVRHVAEAPDTVLVDADELGATAARSLTDVDTVEALDALGLAAAAPRSGGQGASR